MLKVSSIFKTIQGEGMLQGIPSVFIRLYGCNLNCSWCDLEYDKGYQYYKNMEISKIIEQVEQYKLSHVVITGGEPILQRDIIELTELLKDKGFHISIETNGTIQRKISADLISISPKLSNSKICIDRRINKKAIQYYLKNYRYQLKFVVASEKDMVEINTIIKKIPEVKNSCVLLMPLASTKEELEKIRKSIIQLCIKYDYRYCDRLQLSVWNNEEEI